MDPKKLNSVNEKLLSIEALATTLINQCQTVRKELGLIEEPKRKKGRLSEATIQHIIAKREKTMLKQKK